MITGKATRQNAPLPSKTTWRRRQKHLAFIASKAKSQRSESGRFGNRPRLYPSSTKRGPCYNGAAFYALSCENNLRRQQKNCRRRLFNCPPFIWNLHTADKPAGAPLPFPLDRWDCTRPRPLFPTRQKTAVCRQRAWAGSIQCENEIPDAPRR